MTHPSLSLKKKGVALKKTKQLDVSCESLTTHDVANSINNITGQSACKWLVMEWDGRESSVYLLETQRLAFENELQICAFQRQWNKEFF